MIIVVDTETNGFPTGLLKKGEKNGGEGRLIQLAYEVLDDDLNVIKSFNKYIKPDGWTVPKKQFWIENGFSTEMLMKEGHPISEVLDEFLSDYNNSKFLAAHNMEFDYKILHNEMVTYNKKAKVKLTKICTMIEACNIYGYQKWQKLINLHTDLFGVGFENAHDAMADVIACRKILCEMINHGGIEIIQEERKLF